MITVLFYNVIAGTIGLFLSLFGMVTNDRPVCSYALGVSMVTAINTILIVIHRSKK